MPEHKIAAIIAVHTRRGLPNSEDHGRSLDLAPLIAPEEANSTSRGEELLHEYGQEPTQRDLLAVSAHVIIEKPVSAGLVVGFDEAWRRHRQMVRHMRINTLKEPFCATCYNILSSVRAVRIKVEKHVEDDGCI